MRYPDGEQAVLVTQRTVRDPYGDNHAVGTPSRLELASVGVAPATSTETGGGAAPQVIDGALTIGIDPDDLVDPVKLVEALTSVEILTGAYAGTYTVAGTPKVPTNPFTGTVYGVEVTLERHS